MNRLTSLAAWVALFSVVGGCGGGDAAPAPLVDRIDEAVDAVEAHYGSPQEYFEISATIDAVSVIVAVDDATAAEQASLGADGFTAPVDVGEASGATFTADAMTFDRERIFDRLRAELDDPVIIDFAVQGGGDGAVIYDASVASDEGGVLLVLLGPSGQILGAQGR